MTAYNGWSPAVAVVFFLKLCQNFAIAASATAPLLKFCRKHAYGSVMNLIECGFYLRGAAIHIWHVLYTVRTRIQGQLLFEVQCLFGEKMVDMYAETLHCRPGPVILKTFPISLYFLERYSLFTIRYIDDHQFLAAQRENSGSW